MRKGKSSQRLKFNTSKLIILDASGVIWNKEKINKRVEAGFPVPEGERFDSELEARYWRDVIGPKLATKEIVKVQRHPKYVLQEAFTNANGVAFQAVTYTPDFMLTYWDDRIETVETKGDHTDEAFSIRRRWFEHDYPWANLIVLKWVQKFGGWITIEQYAAAKRKEQAALRKTKKQKQREEDEEK